MIQCRLYQISSRTLCLLKWVKLFCFCHTKEPNFVQKCQNCHSFVNKDPLKRAGFIINHLALAWLVIPWPLHLTFFCLLIIFLTILTSLVCYAIFFFQIICFVACITIKICIYSVFWQNIFTKKPSKFVMISQNIKKTLFDFLYRPLLGFLISLWNILKFSGPSLELIWTQSLVNNLQTRKKIWYILCGPSMKEQPETRLKDAGGVSSKRSNQWYFQS